MTAVNDAGGGVSPYVRKSYFICFLFLNKKYFSKTQDLKTFPDRINQKLFLKEGLNKAVVLLRRATVLLLLRRATVYYWFPIFTQTCLLYGKRWLDCIF